MKEKYILVEVNSNTYFINPCYDSWKFTIDKEKATTFDNREDAEKAMEEVNRASANTYWDYDDIQPIAGVMEKEDKYEMHIL